MNDAVDVHCERTPTRIAQLPSEHSDQVRVGEFAHCGDLAIKANIEPLMASAETNGPKRNCGNEQQHDAT